MTLKQHSFETTTAGIQPDSEQCEADRRATPMGFLVAALRAFLNPEKLDALAAMAPLFRDWEGLIELANTHSVSPILWRAIDALPAGAVPEEVLDRLRAAYDRNALRNLIRAGELRRLCGLFEKNGIPAVPFKGPLLALEAFGDVGLRQFGDLDFLFSRAKVLRARDVLAKEGYRMSSDVHWPCESAHLRSINAEFTMVHGDVAVDLHWRMLPSYFPYRFDSLEIWDELTAITIAGRSVPTLSTEHQLLFLAAHGAKHCWARLRWICDFAQFLRTSPISWSRAFDLASRAGSSLMLAHALVLARDLLGVALPMDAQSWLQSGRLEENSQRIASSLTSRILAAGEKPPGPWESLAFLLEFSDEASAALRLLHAQFIAPTEAEWRMLALPPQVYLLYYPLRLARLALKYTVARWFPSNRSAQSS